MMTEYVTFLMSYKKEITRVLQSKYCGKNDAALSGRERMKDNKFEFLERGCPNPHETERKHTRSFQSRIHSGTDNFYERISEHRNINCHMWDFYSVLVGCISVWAFQDYSSSFGVGLNQNNVRSFLNQTFLRCQSYCIILI